MIQELPKGLVNLMYIFNTILRLEYWLKSLKTAQIMIQKPGKKPTEVSPYRPISLQLTISKVLEKLILKKLMKTWIPIHQFGFRQAHSTVQCHRITDIINKAMENKHYGRNAFLDVSQAFNKVWHPGLLFKIKRILPSSYFNLPKSYLNKRQFETKINR